MKTLWGIRHVRYWLALAEFKVWWLDVGHVLGAVPNQADLEYLDDIWSGRA